jgi:hypothetical protein
MEPRNVSHWKIGRVADQLRLLPRGESSDVRLNHGTSVMKTSVVAFVSPNTKFVASE